MREDMIVIAKKPGIKNCVRINSVDDIPDFLMGVIKVIGDTLVLDCLEGEERCPLGSVIAYEKLESGKMNVWNKANWKETTKEVNGVFYELPTSYKAVRITDSIPQDIVKKLGTRFSVLPTGEFQIDVGWGLARCAPYNGYLVIYGEKEDGSLDANFLTRGTPSFNQYYVLNENGEILESLQEYDDRLHETNRYLKGLHDII